VRLPLRLLLRELEQPVSAERGRQAVETLFREAHSLKGAARAVNLAEVEAVCADLETRLAKLKREAVSPTPAFVEALALRTDELAALLAADATAPVSPASQAGFVAGGAALRSPPASPADTQGRTPVEPSQAADMPTAAQPTVAKGDAADAARPTARRARMESARSPGETIRIPAARLGAVLVQAEELLAFKVGAGQLAAELHAVCAELSAWRKSWSRTAHDVRALRRASERNANGTGAGGATRSHRIGTIPGQRGPTVDGVLDAVERDEHYVKALCDRVNALQRMAERERRTLAGLADALRDDVKQMLVQPFGVVFELLPRLVRDLAATAPSRWSCASTAKRSRFDRRILEQLKDPLIPSSATRSTTASRRPTSACAGARAHAGESTSRCCRRKATGSNCGLPTTAPGSTRARLPPRRVALGLVARPTRTGCPTTRAGAGVRVGPVVRARS